MEYGVDPHEVLSFQQRRVITSLFKNFLTILEELELEHDVALKKLQENLPEEYKKYVDLADYLTEQKALLLRSKILDSGNNSIRNMEDILKQFEINFAGNKKQ